MTEKELLLNVIGTTEDFINERMEAPDFGDAKKEFEYLKIWLKVQRTIILNPNSIKVPDEKK